MCCTHRSAKDSFWVYWMPFCYVLFSFLGNVSIFSTNVPNFLVDLKLSLFPLLCLSLYFALFMFSEIFSFGQIQLRGFLVDVEGLNMEVLALAAPHIDLHALRTRPDPCDSRGSDWFADQPIDIVLCMLINHADSPHFIWGLCLVSSQIKCHV